MTPDDPRHGTTRGHAAGCREACCREARNADERRRRKHRQALGIVRRIDGTGTRRRIQALWAMGWTSGHIAAACGWSTPQAVTEIISVRRDVYASTAVTVARAYERMSMTVGPSAKNRRDAFRKGWVPPLAWDDIDDPDETPTDWAYLPADRATAIRELADQGENATQIARRLDMTPRALERWCLRHMPDVWREISRREGDWNTTGNLSHQTMREGAA